MNGAYSRLAAAVLAAATLPGTGALAHGFAGDRFFPATILTDDPFVADEMSLPALTRAPTAADGRQEYDVDFDIAKRILPDLGITLSRGWKYVQAPGVPAATGFGAIRIGLQYQLFINPAHEAMALAGLGVTWGHTGRVAALGEPDFTTVTPVFDWGKGFGDLPESLPYLRPFAITGNLSVDFPTKTTSNGTLNPNNLNYGIALEYSLEYLQHHVRDIGLGKPFDRLIPLIELSMTTPLNRGAGGLTTGTWQPGFIWAGQYYQIGAEMIFPVNKLAGKGVGGVVQFHLFLDDLFPKSIGKPLFSY
jgi:hypothetical protein